MILLLLQSNYFSFVDKTKPLSCSLFYNYFKNDAPSLQTSHVMAVYSQNVTVVMTSSCHTETETKQQKFIQNVQNN